MKLQKTLFGAALAFAAASPAMAVNTVTLDFEGLNNFQAVSTGYGNPNLAVAFTWATGNFEAYTPGATQLSNASIFVAQPGPGSVTMVGQGGQNITNISFDYFIYSNAGPLPTLANQTLTWKVTDALTNTVLNTASVVAAYSGATNPVYSFSYAVVGVYTQLNLKLENPGRYIGYDNFSVTAVPEPGTYAMLLAGLAAVGFLAKRRRQPA